MADIEEQPLPRTFEEFNEQRKAAFIRVKDYKQAGNRLVGFLCSYTPLEIIDAAGASSVALCGTSDEVIPEAEKVLPANLCPLIKSTYGFAYSQKCPFTYFSDMIIGETTCDGKKKMYEMLAEFKPVYVIELPNRQSEEGIAMYRREIIRFKEELERRFETTITEEAIRHEITVDVEIPSPKLNNSPPHGRIDTTEREACERKHDFEDIECGLTQEGACAEAGRCLRCDHFGYGIFRGGRNEKW